MHSFSYLQYVLEVVILIIPGPAGTAFLRFIVITDTPPFVPETNTLVYRDIRSGASIDGNSPFSATGDYSNLICRRSIVHYVLRSVLKPTVT